MRRLNNILSMAIVSLFVVHALFGALMMLGVCYVMLKPLSRALMAAVCAHALLGIAATASAVRGGARTGAWYLRENAAYWAKRLSGVLILLLLCYHPFTYTSTVNGAFHLNEFNVERLTMQLLLIVAIFAHLAVSVRPMLIARGVTDFRRWSVGLLLALGLAMLFFTATVVFYFVSWQA